MENSRNKSGYRFTLHDKGICLYLFIFVEQEGSVLYMDAIRRDYNQQCKT